ncbi:MULTISPECIES: hypothetical protein [Psychrilyobacter]|uniref:Metal-dependent hydrolase n=1 Tax=Psychrilyobacter piezotolerans TaxID=2293438 RepID=A0ABX9KKZ3_9FUSO|nr:MULTISPECIES: hypothetical protein [Psychrilyobacter]MCS5423058.1 hypothetical protein [Psychrilyobacter sp. S5]NDI76446.1 hypothetical protein [Psychrilyobacter piezotolerans]RDE66042.1 hypothetical protein DV867_00770 [Psychrilyobacter sp. S5]REI43220.1 hypothetical protein DYH56_00770 [Psychrilyobacter piezotolerans]
MHNLDFTAIDIIGLVLGLFSVFIGIKYPDWDFKLKLKHRSILTHSPLITLFFIYIYLNKQGGFLGFGGEKETGFRYFIMGFSIGMGIHFLYDLFPNGWNGSALLHIPILNRKIKKMGSVTLFILFTVISFMTGIKLSRSIEETILFLILGLLLLGLNKRKEGKLIRPTGSFLLLFLGIASYIDPDFYGFLMENMKTLWTAGEAGVKTVFTLIS